MELSPTLVSTFCDKICPTSFHDRLGQNTWNTQSEWESILRKQVVHGSYSIHCKYLLVVKIWDCGWYIMPQHSSIGATFHNPTSSFFLHILYSLMRHFYFHYHVNDNEKQNQFMCPHFSPSAWVQLLKTEKPERLGSRGWPGPGMVKGRWPVWRSRGGNASRARETIVDVR